MTRRAYKEVRFTRASLELIAHCNAIIADYTRQGYRLTLRQLYYQLVTKNLVVNTERSYKNVGQTVSNARLAGAMDWEAIEDRTRQPVQWAEYDSIKDCVETGLWGYRRPRWATQPMYAELWVEKEALAGVLRRCASQAHAVLMVNRGYSSQSAMRDAALRFQREARERDECIPVLFYLGDHDPSGEDMVRDIADRFALFGVDVDVRKLALTMDQVEEYNPPPNPAKMSDSRAEGYVAKHGASSWEVDALPPDVLSRIIADAFDEVIDRKAMDAVIAREELDKAKLRKLIAKMK